ncbi:MAG TPA: hypothetical protein VK730_13770 [Solirubrobacteraceae bacterium]|jgi:hypothetical protein|nr:hypothetical protein [Solirubrobacteraceae bacterium]
MAWGRLDDRYDDHPKIRAALRRNPLAAALHAQAIAYCARHESDGLVDPLWIEERAPTLAKRRKVLEVLEELVLFDRLVAGSNVFLTDSKRFSVELGPFSIDRHLVHDFLDFHPSSAQLQARREKDARRKAEERGETEDVQHGQDTDTRGTPQSVHDVSSRTLTRTGAPAPAGLGWAGLKEERDNSQGKDKVDAGARRSKPVDPDSLPADFPTNLVAVADQALVRLLRLQSERGGNVPTRRGVGLAIAAWPDRDHLRVVGELEHWATAGAGARRDIRDWATTLRNFLEKNVPSAPSRVPKLSGAGTDALRSSREAEEQIERRVAAENESAA